MPNAKSRGRADTWSSDNRPMIPSNLATSARRASWASSSSLPLMMMMMTMLLLLSSVCVCMTSGVKFNTKQSGNEKKKNQIDATTIKINRTRGGP